MDWKWMIERGGRVTFTVISGPLPHARPAPNTHRHSQWHWKLVRCTRNLSEQIESGPSSEIGTISQWRKTRTRIFYLGGPSCCMCPTLWRCCAIPCSLNSEGKATGERNAFADNTHSNVCGRSEERDRERFFVNLFKITLMWKISMHTPFSWKYTHSVSLSAVYKQNEGGGGILPVNDGKAYCWRRLQTLTANRFFFPQDIHFSHRFLRAGQDFTVFQWSATNPLTQSDVYDYVNCNQKNNLLLKTKWHGGQRGFYHVNLLRQYRSYPLTSLLQCKLPAAMKLKSFTAL